MTIVVVMMPPGIATRGAGRGRAVPAMVLLAAARVGHDGMIVTFVNIVISQAIMEERDKCLAG